MDGANEQRHEPCFARRCLDLGPMNALLRSQRAALCVSAGLWLAGAAGAQQDKHGTDLLELLERPVDFWLEVHDFDVLVDEFQTTRLAQLVARLSESVDAEGLAQSLSLPSELPEGLLNEASGGARGVLRELALEAGVPEEQADLLLDSLSGNACVAWLAAAEPEDGDFADLVVSVGLAPGGSTALVDQVLAALEEDPASSKRPELVELARENAETRAAWRWPLAPARASGFLVVRGGLAAWCFQREVALQLLHAEPGKQSTAALALGPSRTQSRARSERILLRLQGGRLEDLTHDSDVSLMMAALGLDGLRSFELGLRIEQGELVSRLRFEGAGPAVEGAARDAQASATTWSSLDVLPADALVVLGVRQSPWALARGIAAFLSATDHGAHSRIVERFAAVPFFAILAQPGVLRDETLLFARPAGSVVPMVYLATPQTPGFSEPFRKIVARGDRDVLLGSELRLQRKSAAGLDAWVLFDDQPDKSRSLFSLASFEDTWVLSDVSAHLHNLAQHRTRERLTVREENVAAVRAALLARVSASGHAPSRMSAFLHVRSTPIVEFAWPYAQMVLQYSGAVEDPEDLPDAFEVGELLGDTTLVVFDLDGAVEVWGSGLLGGLALFL
jgi:hypothetical protein